MKQFLVELEEDRHVISMEDDSPDLLERVYSVFDIDSMFNTIKLQKFDEQWGTYLNLDTSTTNLPDRSRLRATVTKIKPQIIKSWTAEEVNLSNGHLIVDSSDFCEPMVTSSPKSQCSSGNSSR